MMKELEVLLSKRWILKSRDKEMYYKLRDALGNFANLLQRKWAVRLLIILS